jgi:Glycosyl transferase family 2
MQSTLAAPRLAPDTYADPVEVSVVMPCLNEARTVGKCVIKAIKAFRIMGVRGEVVVADNGSTDGSQTIARQHGARVVNVSRKGYGSALQAGIEEARGEFVIMGDADDSYDFGKLEPFIVQLRNGDDIVMGNRFRGGIRPGAMPWHHKYIGNPILTGILNLFFRSPIGDAHCGLRGFRKDAYHKLGLSTTGMEFASEMVVKACLNGLKMSEVPIILHPDGRDRPPHLRSFRDGWRHLRFMLLMCPLWLYMIPALLLTTVGLGLMAWLTAGPKTIGAVTFDVHTMLLGSFCAIVGYQTLWLWAFARSHGASCGILPAWSHPRRLCALLPLERGLILGLVAIATGLALNGWLIAEWVNKDFGPLDIGVTLRFALWGFTAIVLGIQTMFGSFFLSMLGMARQKSQ